MTKERAVELLETMDCKDCFFPCLDCEYPNAKRMAIAELKATESMSRNNAYFTGFKDGEKHTKQELVNKVKNLRKVDLHDILVLLGDNTI